MTFNTIAQAFTSTLTSTTSLQLQLTAIVAMIPADKLGTLGQAVAARQSVKPKVVGCPIRALNGALTSSPLLPTVEELGINVQNLVDEGYYSNWDSILSGCRFGWKALQNWGANAGGTAAHLLTVAVQSILWADGLSRDVVARFGHAGSANFEIIEGRLSLAEKASARTPLSAKGLWRQVVTYIAKLYGATQALLERDCPNGTITLYRGISGQLAVDYINAVKDGTSLPARIVESWTTSLQIAKHFASRQGDGIVISKEIKISEVFCYYKTSDIVNSFEEEYLVVTDGILRPSETTLVKEVMDTRSEFDCDFPDDEEEVELFEKEAVLEELTEEMEEGFAEDGTFYKVAKKTEGWKPIPWHMAQFS